MTYESGSTPPANMMAATVRRAVAFARAAALDARLYLWCLLLALGFAYVAGVLCDRANPFHSRLGGYGEIAKLLVSAPFLYVLGPRSRLTQPHQDWYTALKWYGLGYVLPFFIALHFFYLQSISVVNYSLTWSDLSRMHPIGRGVFLGVALLITLLAAYHIRLARQAGIAAPYTLSFVAMIVLIALATWLLRDRYYVHLHHYFVFGVLIPWARFRNPVSVVCQAVCLGIYVEGVAEWGMVSIWALKI